MLIHLLGKKCSCCGSREDLTFDCIRPCGDKHHKLDTSARMSFYRRMFREFNLQLLCDDCNIKKDTASTDYRSPSLLQFLRSLDMSTALKYQQWTQNELAFD